MLGRHSEGSACDTPFLWRPNKHRPNIALTQHQKDYCIPKTQYPSQRSAWKHHIPVHIAAVPVQDNQSYPEWNKHDIGRQATCQAKKSVRVRSYSLAYQSRCRLRMMITPSLPTIMSRRLSFEKETEATEAGTLG